jgi:hypothetical protein
MIARLVGVLVTIYWCGLILFADNDLDFGTQVVLVLVFWPTLLALIYVRNRG